MAALCGDESLAQRTYPSSCSLIKATAERVRRVLRQAGYPKESVDDLIPHVMSRFSERVRCWMQSLPAFLLRSNIRRGLRAVHAAGFLFVRVDRSPGRIILLCRDAWLALQRSVFLQSPRYSEVQGFSAEDFSDWATSSLQSLLKETGSSLKVRAGPRAGAPYAYWTIKNRSMLSAEVPRVKVRPIISHCCHPCRSVLSVAGRALALTVEVATVVVERKHPLHTPMWKLHAGSLAWVSLLSSRTDLVGCAEFDVEDCFLNTPRQLVLDALDFWLQFSASRTRQQPWFAISKDGKQADHQGRPCSMHYWELSTTQSRALVVWEMEHHATFLVADVAGVATPLKQHLGLPFSRSARGTLAGVHRVHTTS